MGTGVPPAERWKPTYEERQKILKELLPLADDTRGFALKARDMAPGFGCTSAELTQFALELKRQISSNATSNE